MKVNTPNGKAQSLQASLTQGVESKKTDGKKGAKVDATNLDSAGSSASTKLNVSDRAQAMQKAKSIASDSSVDEAKIAKFQALIDSGKYKVDAEKVADRLVDDHLETAE